MIEGRVFLSVGEASGDHIGAALVREIGRLSKLITRNAELEADASSPLKFLGVTGPRLREAGVESVVDSSGWGAVGIAQAIRVAPTAYAGLQKAKVALTRGRPGLFIAIDFGYFNIRLARYARSRGWKVLYFMPPGSWRRDKQGIDLPRIANEIVTPFPWSAEILLGMGASAHWFGHPLKQLISSSDLGSRDSGLIGVLPGSRKHELELNLPVIAVALREVDKVAEFALAPSLDERVVRDQWARLAPDRSDRLRPATHTVC